MAALPLSNRSGSLGIENPNKSDFWGKKSRLRLDFSPQDPDFTKISLPLQDY